MTEKKTINKKKRLHLICNAHLDPVWLWEWEEGAAEAISTFRSAADICEETEGFVFNHNEVILYEWIEEYEPQLFKRIQNLVAQGRWHIMGGWFLQPDCNMPSGESFVRQILRGREYFQEKFNVRPKTAINFDPFGHSFGLPQILAKSGFDSYLICRPNEEELKLPRNDFKWTGCDGTSILCMRSPHHYNSRLGHVHEKIERHMERFSDSEVGHMLWGVGNHGGGPSRKDLEILDQLQAEEQDRVYIHSTPERLFDDLRKTRKEFPEFKSDLNPFAVGCYTSAIRLKQLHRNLESELFVTEKMCTTASEAGLMKYPLEELRDAERDLLIGEFHDILPGSSIQPVEDASIRLMNHGLEILSRVKARAFFALAQGQKKAGEGEVPVMVYNPHPFDITTTVECEFQLPDQNWTQTFTLPHVYQGKKEIPSQTEKEKSNLPLDWRKRVVFQAKLKAGSMNRFACRMERLEKKPPVKLKEQKNKLTFKNDQIKCVINTRTGLLDEYIVDGKSLIRKGCLKPLVIQDNEDSWGMTVTSYPKTKGQFKLQTSKESTHLSGVTHGNIPAVRVIEDGDVRTIIESTFSYEDSRLVMTYRFPKKGSEIAIHVRVFWNEKDSMLKLSLPFETKKSDYVSEIAFGVQTMKADRSEVATQRWGVIKSEEGDRSLSVINDGIYGSDFKNGELRLTLLRSPAYSGHPMGERIVLPQDRFSPRIDQGERQFTFYLNGGPAKSRLRDVSQEATIHHEKPFALSFYPHGDGLAPDQLIKLQGAGIELKAMRPAMKRKGIMLRLFETTGQSRKASILIPSSKSKIPLTFHPFEVKTLIIDLKRKKWTEKNLLEE